MEEEYLQSAIITSKQGLVMLVDEWCELLDTYTPDELQELYWDVFDTQSRRLLNPYFKERLKHLLK